MESNWEEKSENIFKNEFNLGTKPKEGEITLDWKYIWKAVEKCMNLVFEATKKECANKAKLQAIDCINKNNILLYSDITKLLEKEGYDWDIDVDKESILNINKPNL